MLSIFKYNLVPIWKKISDSRWELFYHNVKRFEIENSDPQIFNWTVWTFEEYCSDGTPLWNLVKAFTELEEAKAFAYNSLENNKNMCIELDGVNL